MIIVTRLPRHSSEQSLCHAIRALLTTLASCWAAELKRAPLPPLYRSGVVYRLEEEGPEDWSDPWTTRERGWGDCDDLVGWRVAELRAAGEPAGVVCMRREGTQRYHVAVRRADGRLEDPSRVLRELERRRKR